MQNSVITVFVVVIIFLMYDDSTRKAELSRAQTNVAELQAQLSNQQQVAQTAEMAKLQQQIAQLTRERDSVQHERDNAQQEVQRFAATDRARAEQGAANTRVTPQATPNWLQKRIDQSPTLDKPATPVGPSRPYWVDRYGGVHYY